MESDELEKRLEWLDSERQKSNLELKKLKDRIVDLELTIDNQKQKITSLESDLKSVSATTGRVSQFDGVLEHVKVDVLKQISDIEKKHSTLIRNLEKQEKDDNNAVNKRFSEVQSVMPQIAEIKKNLQKRIDEEERLAQRLETITPNFEPITNSLNIAVQDNKRLSDEIQLINKRIADMQIEGTTMRKRLDDERNHNELNIEAFQKLESSMKPVLAQEAERNQAQIAFIEKVSLAQIDRDNIWKTWQTKIDEISGLGNDFTQKIASLEATHRAIKQSQTELDDVNLRFDRRINELTEMHRLNEERFRQEWISFKSDDQKRWTNYQLTQEEQQQDDSRRLIKLGEQIAVLNDEIQESKDAIQLINEETDKQLKSLYTVFHDLIESFDQTFSKK